MEWRPFEPCKYAAQKRCNLHARKIVIVFYPVKCATESRRTFERQGPPAFSVLSQKEVSMRELVIRRMRLEDLHPAPWNPRKPLDPSTPM